MSAPPEVAVNGQALCHCCRQPAAVGRLLCWDHIRAVTAALDPDNRGDRDTQAPASIPAYWSWLDSSPGSGDTRGRRAPGFGSRPPCNLHIVTMRDVRSRPDPVVDVWYGVLAGTDRPDTDRPIYEPSGQPRSIEAALANIASELWDHLGLTEARQPGGDVVAGGVPALAAWLLEHVADLTRHPRAGAIHDFLLELVEQLRGPAGDPREKPDAYCIDLAPRRVGDRELVQCGAPLHMPVPKPPEPGAVEVAIDPKGVVIRCRCGTPYRWCDLPRLRVTNLRDRRERLANQQAAREAA